MSMTTTATSTVTHAGPSVSDKLRKAWLKERRFVHFRGLCVLLLWLVALVLLDLGLDWMFRLSMVPMRMLEAVNILALVWIVYSRWWSQLKRYDPVRIALQVEKRHPELKSLLVSYVQFSAQQGAGQNISPALIEALKNQALQVTAPMNFKEIVNYRELRKILTFSACVLVVFAAMSAQSAEFFKALLTRMMDPTANALYPTRTQLSFVSGDITVPHGTPAVLLARVQGVVPAEGSLYLKSKNGNWEKVQRALQGKDTYEYRVESVYQDFDYYFRVGDARCAPYHVKAVPAPRIIAPRVVLHPPAYTKLPEREVGALSIQSVPEGSVLEWQVTTDQPLAEALLIKDNHEAYRMTLSADGKLASAKLQALDSFSYQFRWKEKAHQFDYAEEVRYSIQVKPDSPPEVELLYPPEDEKGTVNKTLEAVYRATNEHGLGQAWLVYSVDSGPETRIALDKQASKTVTQAVKRVLRDDIKGLQEKMAVTYFIEVADNRDLTPAPGLTPRANVKLASTGPATVPAVAKSMGPNTGKSPARRMEVVTPEEYMAYVQEKKARLITEVGPLYSEESEADKEIRAVIKTLLGHTP